MTETPSGSKSDRLLKYLEELVRLRTKRVTSVESYEKVLWLSDLPQEQECYSRHRDELEEADPELWVQITKRREPRLPSPPEVCRAWVVDPRVLKDSTEEPTLPESILPPLQSADETTVRGITSSEQLVFDPSTQQPSEELPLKEQRLDDFPQVRAAWARYLEQEWRPWSKAHRSWKKVQDVYATLFEIWTALQARGEQLELVLGVGCLVWRISGEEEIRRHVVTSHVNLSFDDKKGVFHTAHSRSSRVSHDVRQIDRNVSLCTFARSLIAAHTMSPRSS